MKRLGGANRTVHQVPASTNLASDTTNRWRARAEQGTSVGVWSSCFTFLTPKGAASLPSCQNATELFDNLTDGKTKVFSSQQGTSDMTDNPFRFTIEKGGDDHPDVGKYRIRIITGNATSGFYDADRIQPSSLLASKT